MSHNNSKFTRDNLFDLKGKVALVTGGGSGIGLMAAQALANNGAKVYIVGRTAEKLDRVIETYGKDVSGELIAIQGDVNTKQGVQKLYDEISSREKCICILVNNAGISSNKHNTESNGSAEELRRNLFEDDANTYEDWSNTYNTNVTAYYFMTAAFLPLLARSTERHPGWSSTVINITSISGMVKTAQHHFAYNASKGAAEHLTRMLAAEILSNKVKVRVNGIAPGVFPSEMTADDSNEQQKSHIPKEEFEGKVPADRPGREEDMAQAVLMFAANQYLSGQTLAVDGGYTIEAGL
jgi:NAD(P)-dependent dehydrogenase (short-subunit alcohol dehydrogenase family)